MQGPYWTFANLLSISRVPLSGAAAVVIFMDGPVIWSLTLILATGLTDLLDGQVARRTNTVSEWGKILDPAADKISAALLGVALVWKSLLPLWVLGAIILRDFLIVTGGVFLTRYLGHVQMSNLPGKIAATAIGITFILALLKADPIVMDIAIWATIGLLGLSFLIYAVRLLGLRNHPAQSNGSSSK